MKESGQTFIGRMLKGLSENISEIGKRQQGIRDDVVKIKDDLHLRMDQLSEKVADHAGRIRDLEEFKNDFKAIAHKVIEAQQKMEVRIAYYLGIAVTIIAIIQLFKARIFG